MKEKLFLEEGISEEVKYEVKLLYEIGVEIDDIEYLLKVKSQS